MRSLPPEPLFLIVSKTHFPFTNIALVKMTGGAPEVRSDKSLTLLTRQRGILFKRLRVTLVTSIEPYRILRTDNIEDIDVEDKTLRTTEIEDRRH